MRRLALACAVLMVGAIGISAGAAPAASAAPAGSAAPIGSLDLKADLLVASTLGPCPAGFPQSAVCAARTSNGRARGLGSVSASYTWALDTGAPTCGAGEAKVLGYPVTIDVAGKGALMISVAEGGQCVMQEPSRNEPQSFTIVGGTGLYTGASGQGTVERVLGQTSSGASGRETWTATMNVPGLEFDIVAPVLTVTAPKPVRVAKTAKRARVRYRVAGLDAVDGVVPVVCRPRSGAWFPLGRSLVRCSATDASGNEAARSFGVVVRRGR